MSNKSIQKIIIQAVILAGGKGTRMYPFTENNPKPMYHVEGIPFIEYLILQVKEFGIREVVLLLGYLPEKIIDYLGDGSKYNIRITYDITPVEYETGARMLHAKDKIADHFLFMYCDNYCPVNFKRLEASYFENDIWIQLSAYENKDGYTKSNLKINDDGMILSYDKKRVTPSMEGVDIGYAIINKEVMQYLSNENLNFEANIYPEAIRKKKMFATITKHRYYSIGSWDRIKLTEEFFKNKATIFLDRDGTVNKKAPKACYIESSEEFKWLPQAKEAIRKLKENNYRIILITNQPGIARGNLTEQALQEIHNKMQNELKEINSELDKIYYCPHNWEDGCDCRKPKPGMLYQAQKELSLDLTKCILIGDDDRDIEAGKETGCKTIKVDETYNLWMAVSDILGENL